MHSNIDNKQNEEAIKGNGKTAWKGGIMKKYNIKKGLHTGMRSP